MLVTGSTGQGKTTLLASLIRELLEDPHANLNIVEFASPPEYEYDMIEGETSMYAVSDIPDNYKTGAMAMRGAMHRAPNVILAPEARDGAMMALSLEACLTGHLTLTTIQTSDVASTIQRAQVMFPKEEREERSIAMMQNLRLIVSCHLIRSADGKQIQLREFLPFGEQTRRELLSAAAERLADAVRGVSRGRARPDLRQGGADRAERRPHHPRDRQRIPEQLLTCGATRPCGSGS